MKGRKIWGALVPFNQVWRAGANENTTILFSDDVSINGNTLKAGKYGIHIIPNENKWLLIFSKNYWSWGSFNYDETEDALRITLKPEPADHMEYLLYYFESSAPGSTDIILWWEKIKVKFNVTVDVHKIVLESFRKEFENLPGFFWQSWNQAANYCLQNKINTEEALLWANRSIAINSNFNNRMTKALLLEVAGKTGEAENLKSATIETATEFELNNLGYQLPQTGRTDEAVKIFELNTKKFPESWNVRDSLAEGYLNQCNKVLAVKYYQKAFEMATDEQQRNRIRNLLENLKTDN